MTYPSAVAEDVTRSRFLSGARLKTIFVLAVPILATMLSANLMGLIDTGMIGQLGDAALAGVSVGSTLFFTMFSLIMGVSAGVQVIVARRLGDGDAVSASTILNAGIAVAAVGGLLMMALGYLIMPWLISAMNSDPAVIEKAQAYLAAVLPSVFIGGISSAFAGYWLGVQRPGFNFLVVLVQLSFNAFFNYLLIFGNFGFPRMEMAGAGLGTTLAQLVALSVNVLIAFWVADKGVFLQKLPSREGIKKLVTFSLPMGLQQFLFTLGLLVFVRIVGLLGTETLAAFQVVVAIMMTSLMLAIGLGTIATTLVSSALGKGKPDEASQWGWEVAVLGSGILLLVGVGFFFAAESILAVFIAEPATAKLALVPLRIMIISVWLEAFGRILAMALVGAGAVTTVFKITFFNQWLLRLPLYWLIGVYLQQGLVGIFLTMLALYILQAGLFVHIWQKKRWAQIET